MKTRPVLPTLPLVLFGLVYALVSCNVPLDDARRDSRVFAARGAIRGSFRYDGPPPCSASGHIVGTGIVFVWDKANPPPPFGTATRPVNFVAIPGDTLFPDRARYAGKDGLSCPSESETVDASAEFAISPLEGGAYYLTAFFNRSGNFLPTFAVRNMAEAGDVVGGYLNLQDLAVHGSSDLNYRPLLLPVEVGYPDPIPDNSPVTFMPNYRIPTTGFVADSVPVNVSTRIALARPYFYVSDAAMPAVASDATPGNLSGNVAFVPVVRMTQDHQILAPATKPTAATVTNLQNSFIALRLDHGLPPDELAPAIDPQKPYVFQLNPAETPKRDGFAVFSKGAGIAESALISALWPEVVFSKLVDDPNHLRDPQSLALQTSPQVLITAITLWDDALLTTNDSVVPKKPTALKDHIRALIRPSALCLPNSKNGDPGILVTPHATGLSSDPAEAGQKPLVDAARVLAQGQGKFAEIRQACLPLGRYAISTLYPTGQAWTSPNEAGACATSEGTISGGACSSKPRPLLPSQGTRAVLEVVPPMSDEGRAFCAGAGAVPAECIKK